MRLIHFCHRRVFVNKYFQQCLCIFSEIQFCGWMAVVVNWCFLICLVCCFAKMFLKLYVLSVYVMYVLWCILQLCTKGIKVTIVCPGPIETSAGAASSSQRNSSEVSFVDQTSIFFKQTKGCFLDKGTQKSHLAQLSVACGCCGVLCLFLNLLKNLLTTLSCESC
jgi:hypothetical protein